MPVRTNMATPPPGALFWSRRKAADIQVERNYETSFLSRFYMREVAHKEHFNLLVIFKHTGCQWLAQRLFELLSHVILFCCWGRSFPEVTDYILRAEGPYQQLFFGAEDSK